MANTLTTNEGEVVERVTPDDDPVTPEMIEAGYLELLSFDHDYESEKTAAERIYRAMRAMAPR